MISEETLAKYESNMIEYGRKHAEFLKDQTQPFDPLLAATYYDSAHVFFQIADYTKDDSWLEAAQNSLKIYRDRYVIPNNGNVPGYWKFPHGLLRAGDLQSQTALIMLAQNGAYALPTTPLSETADSTMSREVAYLIMTALCAEKVGEPLNPKYILWIEQALGHLDQWFDFLSAPYVRPFMVALTSQALIEDVEAHPISKASLIEDLKIAASELRRLWTGEAFQYTDRQTSDGGTEPAPDLNLLIAPLFGWLYRETRFESYKEFGDEIFTTGVEKAYLGGAKQFNQNYRWSMKYLEWTKDQKPKFGTLEYVCHMLEKIEAKL